MLLLQRRAVQHMRFATLAPPQHQGTNHSLHQCQSTKPKLIPNHQKSKQTSLKHFRHITNLRHLSSYAPCSPSPMLTTAGSRWNIYTRRCPVHVEIGGSYADANVQKPEIAFGEYVEYMRHFENKYGDGTESDGSNEDEGQPPPHEIVYLAQNDLPPALYGDFDMPKLCDDASFARKYGVGEGNLYSCMIWMGPRGTLSPLHFDPLDNLLCQVVGTKRVLLYPRTAGLIDENGDVSAAEGAAWTYAGSNGMQCNTSPVNVENPDLQKYPLFAKSPSPIECILRPGDCLYIPAKWWHHVRSLSRSLSVNVWWR